MSLYELQRVGGADIAVFSMPQVESVSIGLWFRVGSRYEPARLNGAAHFLEHMMFKGTRRRNALEITESIESKGGDLNAFTAEEMTCFFARLDGDHLDLVTDVLFDMLWHSSFPQVEVERERRVIGEEIRMYEDQPAAVVQEMLNGLLWPGSSLGRPVTGTEETVGRMKREDLMLFWKRHYTRSSLVVSVAGHVEVSALIKGVRDFLMKGSVGEKRGKFRRVDLTAGKRPRCLGLPRELQQVQLAMGFRGFSRTDRRRYAEKLLSVILGENMSSRLFQSIRERHGLAYSVNTSVARFSETGAFYIQAGLEPEKLERALGLVLCELEKIKKKGVSRKELERAKDYAIGQLKLSLENTSSQMMWMGECLIGLNRIYEPREVMDRFREVSVEEILSVARDLFVPGRLCIACLGPGATTEVLESVTASYHSL